MGEPDSELIISQSRIWCGRRRRRARVRARAIVLRNEKGAVLTLSGRQVGLIANADLSGLAISLQQEPLHAALLSRARSKRRKN
jgi:hypothetical protein